MIVNLINSLRDRLPMLKLAGVVILLMLVAYDGLLVSKEHAHTALEQYPGFWSLFGFVSTLLIVMASKGLEAYDVVASEDYYDK